MNLYYPITIDLYNTYPLPKMTAQQHNVGRGALITITANGLVIVPTNETIRVFTKRPDGNVSYLDCKITNDGKIQVDFSDQMLSSVGSMNVELQLTTESTNITTPIFIVEVQKSNIKNAVKSSNEFKALDTLVTEAEDAALRAEDASEKAAKEAAKEAKEQIVNGGFVKETENHSIQTGINTEAAGVGSIAHGKELVVMADDSAGFGRGNTVGLKGYYIKALSFDTSEIILSKTQVTEEPPKVYKLSEAGYYDPSTGNYCKYISELTGMKEDDFEDIGYKQDDRFNIIVPYDHYILCGTITSIYKNCITFDSLPFDFMYDLDELVANQESKGVTWVSFEENVKDDDYTFSVPTKPTIGVINISRAGFANGDGNIAAGGFSDVSGADNLAAGNFGHVEGMENTAGYSSHAEGSHTEAIGKCAHTEGNTTFATAPNSHAEGNLTKATANQAHAEGRKSEANGIDSHAEGFGTKANGMSAHAEGESTQANNKYTHSEGRETIATGQNTHAEGFKTETMGMYSHAEGRSTQTRQDLLDNKIISELPDTSGELESVWKKNKFALTYGWSSHIEGRDNLALADQSHAEGKETETKGENSHAEGYGTVATCANQHVQGRWNAIDSASEYAHIVGNGKSDSDRSNAHTLTWEGNAWYKSVSFGGTFDAPGANISFDGTSKRIVFSFN